MVTAAAVGNQIKIAIAKGRTQCATLVPIYKHATIVSPLLSELKRLSRKIEAVNLEVLLGEEYRVRPGSASQVKNPRAWSEPCSQDIRNQFGGRVGVIP